MTVATHKISTNSPMTLEAFLTYDDGTENRYELVDGVLVEMGAESTINTKIAVFLILAFGCLGLNAGQIAIKQKIEVSSSYASVRDPDLMIHTEASMLAIEGRSEACLKLHDPNPLLVAEVVSPGTESTDNYQRDYGQKPVEYADRGIPEMWQVDPERKWVKVGTLVDATYEFQTFTGQDAIVSPTFPNLNLTAEQILAAGV